MAAIQKMNAEMAKLREQNKQLAENSKKQSQEATSGFQKGITSLATMAGSYFTVSAAANVLTKELQSQWELQQKIASITVKSADLQRDFLFNAGFRSEAEQKKLLSRIDAISSRTGVSTSTLYTPGGAAVSASGGNDERAFAALEEAAKIAPHSAPQIELLAGAFQDLARASSSGQVKDSVALMAAMSQASRVTNPAMVAKNLSPAFIGVKARGGSDVEAGGLIAAMTQGTADISGELSGTASINLAKQLEEFLPQSDRFTFSGGKRKLAAKGTGYTTTEQRIKALQADAGLREQFLGSVNFEAKADAASRGIFDPGSAMARQYEASKMQFEQARQAATERQLADVLNQGQLQKTGDFARRTEQQFEKDLMDRPEIGRYQFVRDRLEKTLTGAGYGWSDRTMARMNFEGRSFAQDAEDAGIGALGDVMSASKGRLARFGGDAEATQKIVDKLQEQINVLREFKNQRVANPNAQVEGQ